MKKTTATTAEMKVGFEHYLKIVSQGEEVIVTKNGREVGRFVPKEMATSFMTDLLTGILREREDLNEERMKGLKEKYATSH